MNDSKMHEPIGGPSWPVERERYGSYAEEPCEITTDGWCATHSTSEGPVYCERRGVEWIAR